MKDQEIVGLYEAYQSIYSNVDEEVETWVNSLVEEGYDLSDYTWDDMYEFYLDEGAAGDVAARAQKLANQRKGQTPERKKMYQDLANKAAARERGPFKGGTSRQGMTPSKRTRSREASAYHAGLYGGSATYGKGSLPKGKKLERQRARGVSERFESWLDEAMTNDLFDTIIKHLVTEGYADTNESALAIMANMSEDWRESIVDEIINEGRRTSLSALSRESQQRRADKERGRPETQDEKHRRLRLGRYAPSQYNYEKGSDGQWKVTGRKDGEKD